MDPERLNLAPLDPSADPERWERLVAAITRAAAPELARRAASRSPLVLLSHWSRPTLSAAAVLLVLSALALRFVGPLPGPAPVARSGVVEALAVPAPAAAWLEEERAPTVDDLILVLEGENP